MFGRITHCHLIGVGFGPGGAPCAQCQSEWIGGQPPTKDSLPPVLVEITNGLRDSRRLRPPQAPRERKPLPPLIVRMKTFAVAFAKYLVSGGKTLPAADANARLAICAECPERTKYFLADACGVCGCALAIKSKWPEQRCPLSKWPGDRTPCGKPCGK